MKLNRKFSTKRSYWVKNKVKSLYFDINYLDIDSFRTIILKNFQAGVQYSILLKFKYNGGSYGMAGKQIPFKLSNKNRMESVDILYKDVSRFIETFCERYRVEYIDVVQVLYIVMTDIPELKLNNINKVKLNKDFIKVKDAREKFSSKLLPLTTDVNYYGKYLTKDLVLKVFSIINDKKEALNLELEDFNKVDSVYLYKDEYIIINYKLDEFTYIRKVFSALSGVLYLEAKDNILDKKTFTRTIGKSSFTINYNQIVKVSSMKVLFPIKNLIRPFKASSNPKIGTLDLETYVDIDGYSKVYAIGFFTNLEVNKGENPKTFYVNEEKNSSSIVLNCIDYMLTNKYNDYTFYTHNFGGYDGIFLLKILTEYNQSVGFDYYKLSPLFRDNKLLKLEITLDIKSGYSTNKIVLIDSYNLLSNRLEDLSHSFGLDVVKGSFPHTFVTRDTLFYKGNTPSKEH